MDQLAKMLHHVVQGVAHLHAFDFGSCLDQRSLQNMVERQEADGNAL